MNFFEMIHSNVESGVNALTEIYQSAAECMRSCSRLPRAINDTKTYAKWWDVECDSMKSRKNTLLRKFRLTDSHADLLEYTTYRNQFKQLCKTKTFIVRNGTKAHSCIYAKQSRPILEDDQKCLMNTDSNLTQI